MLPLSRKRLLSLIIVMALGMLFVGLFPFNYLPPNIVSLDEGGLHFYSRGIAYIKGDAPQTIHANPDGAFTLEIQLDPEQTYSRHIPHILSLCDRSGRQILYLGQWKNSLIIRLMNDGRWIENIRKEIGVGGALKEREPVSITLVLAQGKGLVYIDGQLVSEEERFPAAETVSIRPIHSLVFGNSPIGDSPWQGGILRFSFIPEALTGREVLDRYHLLAGQGENGALPAAGREVIRYEFDKLKDEKVRNLAGNNWQLFVPRKLKPLKREFLAIPPHHKWWSRTLIKDAVINTLGFIPLGLGLAIFFNGGTRKNHRWLHPLLAILMGGLLSFFIETNQAFLVTRNSSVLDLFLNTVGTGLGAMILLAWKRWLGIGHTG